MEQSIKKNTHEKEIKNRSKMKKWMDQNAKCTKTTQNTMLVLKLQDLKKLQMSVDRSPLFSISLEQEHHEPLTLQAPKTRTEKPSCWLPLCVALSQSGSGTCGYLKSLLSLFFVCFCPLSVSIAICVIYCSSTNVSLPELFQLGCPCRMTATC